MYRGTEPTFRPSALARALVVIIALLVAGLAGFLVAHSVTQINSAGLRPVHPPAATGPTPTPPILSDLGRNDLASVVTVEAELQNGSEESLGTGWIFDTMGDVVTNAHVISGNDALRVTDRAGHTHVARLLQSSASNDLALIRVVGTLPGTPLPVDASLLTTAGLQVIILASSRATGNNDWTEELLKGIHATAPFAGSGTATGQPAPPVYTDMLYLTGARIYEGNSGGPVLDAQGKVIGIITLASPTSPDAYAIPISRVISQLRTWVTIG